ncbi:MAG TPA: plastocyanin/azurin family copper-binding protein [Baekduia sp.]|nr:plastocyanin/azurin family copper-binding protein [Baekduia sp.]
MRLTTTLAATVLATAALVAAGCGDDNDKSDNSAAPAGKAEPTATATTGDTTAGAGVAISMKDIQFDPKDQTAKVGDKVTWTNDDSVDHNVTATEGEDFKSDNFGNGETFSYTLDKAGTIKYTCTLHPGMDGTLTVTQ